MSGRRPKWREVRRFCERQGFTPSATDHDFFDKTFWNGDTAGTKISRGVEGETLTPERWHLVWKRQLRLKSEADFWRGIEGDTIEYDIPSPEAVTESLPPYLQIFLATVHHLDVEEIAQTTKEEAMQLYFVHLARE